MPKLTSLSLPSHSHSLSLKLKPPKMAASLTVSRLLTAPKSISFPTTTAAAPPKTSLFSPKSFSSKRSYTPLPLKHSPHPKPLLRFSTTAAKPISAAIAVGDKLPEATLGYLDAAGDVQTVTVSELTKSKKAVLFAVPGAFTPTCSQKHVPGFVEKSGELKAKGVETIACIAVNDVFVLKAWKENLNIGDEVLLLSDGNGDFTRAIGAELDLSDKPVGLGVRSRRYSLLAEDGVVKVLNLEEGGAFTSSGAEDILKVL